MGDPHVPSISAATALVRRIGFGDGELVADGRFEAGWELPSRVAGTRRSMEAPEERFAALLGGRLEAWPCEELVLRARADLDAGLEREAALQARVALESALAELAVDAPGRSELEADRGPVGSAANAALEGPLSAGSRDAVAACVARIEAALRRRRLGA